MLWTGISVIDKLFRLCFLSRGGDLGGTGGIVPLKKLGGGTEVLLSPHQYLENVLQIYNVKTNKNEKEDETHVTRDTTYKHYPIPLSRLT